MDWSKAKTILIFAFIITNILLIYVLMGEKAIEEPTIKEEFIEDVVGLLKEKNISVDTDIPRDIPHLNTMIVKYEKFGLEELNRRFFKSTGTIGTNEEDLGKVNSKEETILLLNKKLILYENKGDKDLFKNLNSDKAIDIAESFLKQKEFDTTDMEISFIKEEKGVFYIEYSKIYEGVFVERAFTNFQIDKRGVKRFERQWLIEEELGDMKIYISTAPKSVLGLLSMGEVYGKTITDISICYYFDPQKHNYLEDLGEARQGRAVPAWRIQFSDGYKVFIDEY